jgi:hypothetical protein
MLTIRKGQMEAFEQGTQRAFVDQTLLFVEEFFPKHCALLGQDKVREVIRFGWDRAKAHGFTTERCVRLYISLMFMLGSDFPSDPQLPWAAEILNDAILADEDLRIDYLHHKATDYIYTVAVDLRTLDGGGDDPRFQDEARQLRDAPNAVLVQARIPAFTAWLLDRFTRMLPAKAKYVGEGCLRRLIQRGFESARNYGLTTERGVGIYIALMFVLGSGFATEPLLPWVAVVLNDKTRPDPTQKADRLFEEAMAHLQQWEAAGPGDQV